MKVLIIHRNFFVDGGDSRYTIDLAMLLKDKGHKVSVYTMDDYRNISKDGITMYLLKNRYFGTKPKTKFSELYAFDKFRYALRSIFSIEVYREMKKLLQSEKYDVIHLQTIHHVLTIAVVCAASGFHVPVVWTLHDYKLICPASTLYTQGRICERCIDGHYYNAVFHRCKRSSLTGSFIVTLSAYLEHWFKASDKINIFVSPSRFLQDKFISFGFNPEKICVITHPVNAKKENAHNQSISCADGIERLPSKEINNDIGEGFFYFGQLSEIKGIDTILQMAGKMQEISFTLVGSGPMECVVREYQKRFDNVYCIPHTNQDELFRMILKSRIVLVPSRCFETFSFSVLESLSLGKPVIASRIGGIPEIIDHGINGILIDNIQSVDEWVFEGKKLYDDLELIKTISTNAKESSKRYDKETHYEKIMELYRRVIEYHR